MADNKYCSSKFKCGEDLDAALEAALNAEECAANAEEARKAVEEMTKEADGRLSELEQQVADISVSYPMVEAKGELLPEHYYVFGEVDGLSISLVEADDGRAHEYCFEFIPSELFTELKITPAPKWANTPQFPAGHTCQVSILRGVGVMVSA